MVFNSFTFFAILGIFLLVYTLLPRKGQNLWILLSSYFFYGCRDCRFLD